MSDNTDPRLDFATLGPRPDGTWDVLIRAVVRPAEVLDWQAKMSMHGKAPDGSPQIAATDTAAQAAIGMGLIGLAPAVEFISGHVIADPAGTDSYFLHPDHQG
jgi:hypothetical protein